jgi:peroxiredoxin
VSRNIVVIVASSALVVVGSTWWVGRDVAPGPIDDVTIATNAMAIGRALPDVELVSLDGTPTRTTDLADGPLILNFWYSTCEPCRREMPALEAVHREFSGRVTMIGVNIADSPTAAANFVARYGVTFPILLDPAGRLTTAIGIGGAPTTLFVASDGRIVEQVAGEMTEVRIREIVREQLTR